MIDIIVDGKTVEKDLQGIETVAEAVKSIAGDLDRDTSIVKVNLDGEDVTGRFSVQDEPLEAFKRLEVSTGDTERITMETLDSLVRFHHDFLEGLAQVADEFRLGDEEKSHQLFARCLDGLQVIMRYTITASNLLRIPGREIRGKEMNIEEATSAVTSLLDEMIEAQTHRDVILLADLVEYELVPVMEEWGRFLELLKQRGRQ